MKIKIETYKPEYKKFVGEVVSYKIMKDKSNPALDITLLDKKTQNKKTIRIIAKDRNKEGDIDYLKHAISGLEYALEKKEKISK